MLDDNLSLILYLACFAASSMLVYLAGKINSLGCLILGLLIPIVLSGTRYLVGTDYGTYVEEYDNVIQSGWAGHMEPVFNIVAHISNLLTKSHMLLFVIYATITVLFFWKGMKHIAIPQGRMCILWFLFLTMVFPHSMNIMRQVAAAAVIFYGAQFIFRRQVPQFIITVLFAALLHGSALLLLMLYPITIVMNRISKQDRFVIINITLASFAMLATLLASGPLLKYVPVLGDYMGYGIVEQMDWTDAGLRAFIPKTLLFIIMVAVMFMSLRYIKRDGVERRALVAYYTFMLLGFTALVAGLFWNAAERMSYYLFLPFVIVLFVYGISRTRLRKILPIVAITAGIIYFVGTYYFANSAHIIPYRTMLW